MPRYLLDTSALLAHFRQEPGWEKVKAIFDEPDAVLLVASVTLTELARRILSLGFSPQAALETTSTYRLLMNGVVAIDEAIGLTAVEIGRLTPQRLPLVDSLIAASARAQSAVLVHRDQHMTAIPADLVDQILL